MDIVDIPETLDELTEDELSSLAESLAEAASSMSDDAASSDEGVTELERLAGEYERINSHLTERAQLAEERDARATAALSRFAKPTPDAAPDDAVEPDADDEPAAPAGKAPFPPKKAAADTEETDEFAAPNVPKDPDSKNASAPAQSGTDSASKGPVPSVKVNAEKMLTDVEDATELSTEDAVEASTDENEDAAPVVPAAEPVAELAIEDAPEAVELAVEEDDTTPVSDEATTADEADSKEMSVDNTAPAAVPTTEALNAAVDAAPSASLAPTFTSAPAVQDVPRPFSAIQADGRDIDVKDLSERIVDASRRMTNIPSGVFEYVTLAKGTHEYPKELTVGPNEMENFAVFESIKDQAMSLVASGGTCAPLTPSYDIFRLAEPQSPVENALPSVGATRGGIRYIVPPAFTQASGGVRVTTNAQDIAGYTTQTPAGTTLPKPCVSVVCPGVNDVFVDAVSQCVQFGNLNYRVFPEQVEAFMKDLAVVFAQTKEIKYLDAIDANSTSVNLTPDYGATRALTFALSQLTWAYRKRNHMSTTAVLDVYLPDSVLPLLKADMVNDWALGLNFLEASLDDVKRMVFTKLNINATFYYDYSTGDLPNMQQAQAAGSAVPFLASIRAYIFAPGTFVRLDGGTLDVGIVRDSALNGTNNLQIFAEEWIQVAKVGIESVRANITLCPSGTGPAAKTALICGS